MTDYLTDPLRDSVVMHTTFQPLTAQASGYHIYIRYNAMINGTGGGGSQNGGAGSAVTDPSPTALVSFNTGTQSTTPQRDYQVPVYGALVADRPFQAETSGFAGQPSDGLTQLDTSHALTTAYASATDGNVVQTAEISPGQDQFTLALGYGQTQAQSVQAAAASATTPFPVTYARYDSGRRLPGRARSRLRVRALGGSSRLLAVHHRHRDRGPGLRGPGRRAQRRPAAGGAVRRDRRPLPAQRGEMDRHQHSPNAQVIAGSLKVADSVLETDTPSGPGYHRYSTSYQSRSGVNVPVTGSADGYGDCYAPAPMHCPLTGRPWAVIVAATLSPPGATDPNGAAHSSPVPTDVVTAKAGPDGRFSATLPSPAGTWVITAATATPAATGYGQATVVSTA